MKSAIITLGASLLLSACASQPVVSRSDDPIIVTLTGKETSWVEQKLGLPHKRKEMPTGTTIWSYFDNEKGMGSNQCQVSLSVRNGKVEHVDVTSNYDSLFSVAFKPCERLRKKLS